MPGGSSSAVKWYTLLEPVNPPTDIPFRADDPRLGEIVEFWSGNASSLRPGRAVIVGFPQEEGMRRNHGRPGAADGPAAIRAALWRLVPGEPHRDFDLRDSAPLDAGNIRCNGTLEEAQIALGQVVTELLKRRTVPIVLGGGHETAYGHYLGYVGAGFDDVAVINIDAHLDVRPLVDDKGHSGSPFRQMLEHPVRPLPGSNYVCLGVQPQATAREHFQYVKEQGGRIESAHQIVENDGLPAVLQVHLKHRKDRDQRIYLSIDADAFEESDVPGVSAPNPDGLPGWTAYECARLAGQDRVVSSLELVEIIPRLDQDGRSARWAALVVWNFLIGLSLRDG
jgi:formiminoglutamase